MHVLQIQSPSKAAMARLDILAASVAMIIHGEREQLKRVLRLCGRRPVLVATMIADLGQFLGEESGDAPVDVSIHAHDASWCEHPGHDKAQRIAQSFITASAADLLEAKVQLIWDWLDDLGDGDPNAGAACLIAFLLDAFAVRWTHRMKGGDEPLVTAFADSHPLAVAE